MVITSEAFPSPKPSVPSNEGRAELELFTFIEPPLHTQSFVDIKLSKYYDLQLSKCDRDLSYRKNIFSISRHRQIFEQHGAVHNKFGDVVLRSIRFGSAGTEVREIADSAASEPVHGSSCSRQLLASS